LTKPGYPCICLHRLAFVQIQIAHPETAGTNRAEPGQRRLLSNSTREPRHDGRSRLRRCARPAHDQAGAPLWRGPLDRSDHFDRREPAGAGPNRRGTTMSSDPIINSVIGFEVACLMALGLMTLSFLH